MKTIDIVIPTYRPGEKYNRLMERLAAQTYPIQQIIVMNTEEGLYQEPPAAPENVRVYHIRKEEFDHGGTRNRGLRQGKAELVLFLTQDAVPANDRLVEELVKCFEDDSVAAAYGRQLANPDCNSIERYTRQFNYPEKGFVKTKKDLPVLGIKTYFCSDVCAVYRRDVYEELGGFPLKTIFNEDMIFASRVIGAGYGIAYCAEGAVYHSHNYSGMQQFHRNFDLGVSQKQYHQVFDNISSEKEGAGFAKRSLLYLLKRGRLCKAFYFALQCGFKLFGYQLGKRYDKLPQKLVLACTTNPSYCVFTKDVQE